MKRKRDKDKESRPINLILLAISFIIFGGLGIAFMTQMELQPGWAWEDLRDKYPTELDSFETEDIDGNSFNEIISYADIHGHYEPERYETHQYGGIFCLEGASGSLLWKKEYENPIKKVFPLMDVDDDGIKDYFVSAVSIAKNLVEYNGHYALKIYPNLNLNQMISGSNGSDIEISIGDNINFTNNYVHDLVHLNDITDSIEDLILLECIGKEKLNPENQTYIDYNCSITTYFINGTMKNSIDNLYRGSPDQDLLSIEKFQHFGQSHMLFISRDFLILFNLNSTNFLDTIYNVTLPRQIDEYEIIEDLNSDDISEIIATSRDGNISLINGANGGIIREFAIPADYNEISLDELYSAPGDSTTYFLKSARYSYAPGDEEMIWEVFSLDLTSQSVIWGMSEHGSGSETEVHVLNEDMDGDSIDEIILQQRIETLIGFSEVERYTILSITTGEKFAVLNTDFHSDKIITINDIDANGKKDFLVTSDDRVIGLSSTKPLGLWLSPAFPFGFPLFIILTVLLGAGIIILAVRGKRLSYRRRNLKKHRLTIGVNVLAIALITITLALFLLLLNVFNNTLITGTNNTNIVLAFLIVSIVWYGTLPLTAALYNGFAPHFAFIFIRLRNLFFKITKSHNHDIVVLDMGDRKDIGLIIQLKRLILPLLLSIAIGFYAYDTLINIFGYPRTFEVFGSTEFFNFMMGYMLCCVLPMILSFILFSFFISGNYLLDDAGVAYYREHKKYRSPGDIEPISIWAQSIIKGIAGLSALLTFGTFLSTVDFSGFFGEGDAINLVFGLLIVIVMFGGIPFLTGFSYLLIAGEVMELNVEDNVQELYNIMEKNGYDTTRRKITNIYPTGYKKEENIDSLKKTEMDE